MQTATAIAVGLASALLYFYVVVPLRQRKSLLPPGPPGRWLFGNAAPPPYAHRYYADAVEQYGPVVSFRYGKRVVCIVGRYQAALDILVKHSGETMDRPRHIAASEMLSGGLRVVLTRAGDRIRTYRRYAASVVITMTYGKTTPTSYSDREVQGIIRVARRFGASMRPGAFLVDTYPFLQYVPGYARSLRKSHLEELAFFRTLVADVRAKTARGEALEFFVAYLLQEQAKLQLSDNEVAYLAGAMFGAGSDTTASALSVVTLAAALHPEEQAKVQAQLDKVVGRDRAPTFEDEGMLPEVSAFFLEAARWRPQIVGGFAHRATKDIVCKDYVIPAGTEVVGHHLAISRDPDVYPGPNRFKPQRWLDEEGQLRKDMKFFRFGFGRRVCVGEHLADKPNSSVFINTALILWTFNIKEDPVKPIDPDAFTDEANVFPKPFTVNFVPRVSNLAALLNQGN